MTNTREEALNVIDDCLRASRDKIPGMWPTATRARQRTSPMASLVTTTACCPSPHGYFRTPLSFGLPAPSDLRRPLQSSGLSCSMPFELFGPLASYLRLSSTHADSLDLSRRELDSALALNAFPGAHQLRRRDVRSLARLIWFRAGRGRGGRDGTREQKNRWIAAHTNHLQTSRLSSLPRSIPGDGRGSDERTNHKRVVEDLVDADWLPV
jgi:hypothetical protein